MENVDRMGVIVIVSHLIITLAFIGVYAYTLVTGQVDDTLRTILTVIVGYWFGAMGKEAIMRRPEQRRKHNYERGEQEKEVS